MSPEWLINQSVKKPNLISFYIKYSHFSMKIAKIRENIVDNYVEWQWELCLSTVEGEVVHKEGRMAERNYTQ